MNNCWSIYSSFIVALVLCGQALSQPPPVSPFLSGGTASDPGEFSLIPPIDPKQHLNPIWLYVDTKADEIEETGRFTHAVHRMDTASELKLSELIVEYGEKFYDHEIDLRIKRMCEAYETGLQSMDPLQSATIALRNLETGEQLRARRSAVADQFLDAVIVQMGASYADMVAEEAKFQADTLAAYSIETTRDWIETHDLDRVGYMKNACGF